MIEKSNNVRDRFVAASVGRRSSEVWRPGRNENKNFYGEDSEEGAYLIISEVQNSEKSLLGYINGTNLLPPALTFLLPL